MSIFCHMISSHTTLRNVRDKKHPIKIKGQEISTPFYNPKNPFFREKFRYIVKPTIVKTVNIHRNQTILLNNG